MAANIDPVAQSCFEEVVAALDLPNDVKTRATEHLTAVLALGIPPDAHRPGPWVWAACSIFMALYEHNMPGGRTLGDVLKATGLERMDEFLSHLTLLSQRLPRLSEELQALAGGLR
ncbi:hypothetical protein Naga_101418g1 [Nannochloropsis gaditana]|uniref:Uncharacterized protein n=1 Tax=Nannochloropsis gaditana TaxID=72520 RepID=W7TCE5_9STRA|nr:hypothetical protein Naga_101418g1 [Nannochloropsis gaditana]